MKDRKSSDKDLAKNTSKKSCSSNGKGGISPEVMLTRKRSKGE